MKQKTNVSAPTAPSIAARVAHLADLSWSDLKAEWRRLFKSEPAIANRRFVEKRIAHKWQEIEFRKTDRKLLDRNARRIESLMEGGDVKRDAAVPVPGTVLIRHYNGVEHHVRVLSDNSFEYEGQPYASLSKIAREITGTRWSGPAFFGLRKGAR